MAGRVVERPGAGAPGSCLPKISRMRTKLLGLPTSMALDRVGRASLERYWPVARKRGMVSLVLQAAMKWLTGRPALQAMRPAQMLPKLPLGTLMMGALGWVAAATVWEAVVPCCWDEAADRAASGNRAAHCCHAKK